MSDSHETKALAIIPRTIAEVTDLAERLSKSELLPKEMRGKMANVLVTIMAGQEMGLTPMASLRAFHVIEGKPVMGADGMVAIVLGSGKAVYFSRVEESDTAVTYETLRVGSQKPQRCTWTREMIKVAGLNTKDNHRLFPRAMLAARAKSELARDVYPDVLAGCYTPDEAHDFVRAPVDAIDAEIVSETPEVEPPELAQIDTFETEADLKAFSVTLNEKLPPRWKDAGRQRYGARLALLRAKPTEKSA